MAVAKRKAALVDPKLAAQIARANDRAARARAAQPPRGTEIYVLARELADKLGMDVNDVLDDHDERAACREYDGGIDRKEAERLAWCDVLSRYERQQVIK